METTSKQFRKRNAILEVLRQSNRHPSAETIFEELRTQMPDISMATVYRNLNLFKSQGLIRSLGTVNGIERFDGDLSPHVHFICTCCGDVQDLPRMVVPEELCSTASRELGAKVEHCYLTFQGQCAQCAGH